MVKKLTLVIFCLTASLAVADIYRWTDAQGNVHYGDQPPEGVVAVKKEYQSVATPWRKVTMPDSHSNRNGPVPPPPPEVPETVQEPEGSSHQPTEKQTAKTDGTDKLNADAVKLKDQQKATTNQKERVAAIKAKNAAAKAAYNASRSGTSD